MQRRQQQVIILGAFAVVVALLVAAVLRFAFQPSPDGLVAPTQDVNPSGRDTGPRLGETRAPAIATVIPTPLPAPPRGTLVYERSGTIYLAVLGGQERSLVPSGQEPRLAPDGGRVVYVGRVNNAKAQLLTVDTRTRQIAAVTDKGTNPAQPVWSPDGRQIAFRADVGEGRELFVVDANGDNFRQVTRATTGEDKATQPAWAGDGATLYYRNTGDGAFYRIPVAGGTPERVRPAMGPPMAQQFDLTPSPDGTTLAFTQRADGEAAFSLYVMDASGRNERKVASLFAVTAPEQLGSLAWSPDGKAILVASGGAFTQEVYDLKTGRPTAPVGYGAWPSWVAAEITGA